MHREAREASERFAREGGCTVKWSRIWSIEPVPFSAALLDLCEQAVREPAGVSHRLPYGPLHDAAEVSRSGIRIRARSTWRCRGVALYRRASKMVERMLRGYTSIGLRKEV